MAVINQATVADIYAGTPGAETTAEFATGPIDASLMASAPGTVAADRGPTPLGRPVMWWVFLGAGFLLVSLWAQHASPGGPESFKNPKVSLVSILVVTSEVVIGLSLLKVLALWVSSRIGPNGFSNLVVLL